MKSIKKKEKNISPKLRNLTLKVAIFLSHVRTPHGLKYYLIHVVVSDCIFKTLELRLIHNQEYWRDTTHESPFCLDAGDEEELASRGIYNLSPVKFEVRESTYPIGECEPYAYNVEVA